MSKYKRPLTDAERARIPADAAVLLDYLEAHARPGEKCPTLVSQRRLLAAQIGMTIRQFGTAENYLISRGEVRVQNLIPRNEREAERPHYRWLLPVRREGVKA
ncbi:hypothetical protein [Microbacterium sp. NPDC058389]|uniref:hypothetical protein n=1 Tax=Microbacterium sp. NPDC058389 TaxID=3346475 RepID=UPI00365523BE